MTARLLLRYLSDYGCNGTNLLLVAVVPMTFVLAAAPALADAPTLVGGAGRFRRNDWL